MARYVTIYRPKQLIPLSGFVFQCEDGTTCPVVALGIFEERCTNAETGKLEDSGQVILPVVFSDGDDEFSPIEPGEPGKLTYRP